MKIIHNNQANGGGGSGGSGLGSNVGDVFFSYNMSFSSDPRTVDITYGAFSGSYEDYPDLQPSIINAPTIAGLPVTAEYDNSILPYPVSLYEFDDHFWAVGRNVYNTSTSMRLSKMAKGDWQPLETFDIPVGHLNIYEKIIFDGENFYIYQESTGGFTDFIDKFIKFNINTKTYETISFKSKRIVKAYFDNTINKFVVYEVNAIDDNDSDMTKNGIYYYDTFEELKNTADAPLTRYDFSFYQISGLSTVFKNGTLRKKDGQIIYYDKDTKQLREHATNDVFASLIGENGTNTNVTNISGIFEIYGKVFCSFTDVKDSVSYLACLCKEPNEDTTYAYPTTLGAGSPFLIYDQIFDYDFSKPNPYAPAIVYKNSSNIRKALTFNKVKSAQYAFENISSINPPSTLYEFKNYMSEDYWHVNVKALDDLGYRTYDDLGLIAFVTHRVVDMKFNGYGVPYIYIPAYQQGNLNTYLIVKK